MSEVKPYEEAASILGEATPAWGNLLGCIRSNYDMDETWTAGKTTGKLADYRNELKFRRGGKTLVTLYIREGFFRVSVILGKNERDKFEENRSEFSEATRKIYDETHTYHDGKWLGFDLYDAALVDDIIRLLRIKRKPNRKAVEPEETQK